MRHMRGCVMLGAILSYAACLQLSNKCTAPLMLLGHTLKPLMQGMNASVLLLLTPLPLPVAERRGVRG